MIIMLFKIIFVALFLGMLFSLFNGLRLLMNEKENSSRVFKALAWRIGLAVTLFLFLIGLSLLGIAPFHGLPPTGMA